MQTNTFVGRLGKAATLTGSADNQVSKLTLLNEEYKGKDPATGETLYKTVAIQFTAFRAMAKAISENTMKGDQLIVSFRIENNDYEKDGETVYSYNFIIESFEFGAPGKAKRATLEQ